MRIYYNTYNNVESFVEFCNKDGDEILPTKGQLIFYIRDLLEKISVLENRNKQLESENKQFKAAKQEGEK